MVEGLAPKFLRSLTKKLDLDSTLDLDEDKTQKRDWSEVIEESLDPFFDEPQTASKLLIDQEETVNVQPKKKMKSKLDKVKKLFKKPLKRFRTSRNEEPERMKTINEEEEY